MSIEQFMSSLERTFKMNNFKLDLNLIFENTFKNKINFAAHIGASRYVQPLSLEMKRLCKTKFNSKIIIKMLNQIIVK